MFVILTSGWYAGLEDGDLRRKIVIVKEVSLGLGVRVAWVYCLEEAL